MVRSPAAQVRWTDNIVCLHVSRCHGQWCMYTTVQKFGVACHKSLIQYFQTAERTTLYLWIVFHVFKGCRIASLQIDVILYEGLAKK